MILGRLEEFAEAHGSREAETPSSLTGLGKAGDVASMVHYLASDESQFVNGAEFVIDNAATVIEGKISS
jgi:3(or 17)beta-hydroxysteroid dehydrogenase